MNLIINDTFKSKYNVTDIPILIDFQVLLELSQLICYYRDFYFFVHDIILNFFFFSKRNDKYDITDFPNLLDFQVLLEWSQLIGYYGEPYLIWMLKIHNLFLKNDEICCYIDRAFVRFSSSVGMVPLNWLPSR